MNMLLEKLFDNGIPEPSVFAYYHLQNRAL